MSGIRWGRVLGRAFGGLALCLSLAACTTTSLSDYIPRYSKAPAETQMGETVSAPRANLQASIAREHVEPDYIPSTNELMGTDAVQVESYFGSPSLRRAEQASEVWQYATDACVLFVFFYPDEAGETRVSYVTSSGSHQNQATPGDQACVEAVTRAAANAPVGS